MNDIFSDGTPRLGLVSMQGSSDVARGGGYGPRQAPPIENCNPAWDPGCPRPLPNRTMVPYIPSTYMSGPVLYSVGMRLRPKDRSGRHF